MVSGSFRPISFVKVEYIKMKEIWQQLFRKQLPFQRTEGGLKSPQRVFRGPQKQGSWGTSERAGRASKGTGIAL